jgi:hypothetical protein
MIISFHVNTNSVLTVQRWATGWTAGVRFPAGARDSSLFHLEPTQRFLQWLPGALSLDIKRTGREAHHSPPFSVEVKNSGALPVFPNTSSVCT